MVDDYHKMLKEKKTNSVSVHNEKHADFQKVKKKRKVLVVDEVLTENEIKIRNLKPKKVMSILHKRDNEKELVALIKFHDQMEHAFVHASWANKYCPQMVIKFYESRIYWRDKEYVFIRHSIAFNIYRKIIDILTIDT